MKTTARRGTGSLAASIGLLALVACASVRTSAADEPASPEAVVRTWPGPERAAARAMLEKYGNPSQFDRHALVWFNNGNWKRTIVYRRPLHRSARAPGKDFLQQTVGYIVPPEKIPLLKRFDPRLAANPTAGELTFASDSEAVNLLALNLADEIVVGKKSVAQARRFFDRTARLSASGKSSPYLEGLRFDVDNNRYMTPTGADR